MIARFPGRCGLCDEAFFEGDEIEQVDGEWCHEACADDHQNLTAFELDEHLDGYSE